MKIQYFLLRWIKFALYVWNTIRNINQFTSGWTSKLVPFPSCCKSCSSKHESMHISVGYWLRFLWVYAHCATSGPYVNSIFRFSLKKRFTADFQSRGISLHSCKQCKRINCPLILTSNVYYLFSVNLVEMDFKSNLIFIFLMLKFVEKLANISSCSVSSFWLFPLLIRIF